MSKCLPLIQRFENHLQVSKSRHTALNYASDVKDLERYLRSKRRNLLTATSEDLTRYLAALRTRVAPSSSSRRVAGVKSFYRFAVRQELVAISPAEHLRGRRSTPPAQEVPSYAEIVRLLEAPPVQCVLGLRDRAMLELLYGAGLRAAELVGLDFASVDVKERMLRVMGKGQKERLCPVNATALRALATYLERRAELLTPRTPRKDANALFIGAKKGRLGAGYVWQRVTYWAEILGMEEMGPHKLRHAYATHLLDSGARIEDIQLLLGHTTPRMTVRYLHVTRELLRRVYNQAHPRAHSAPPAHLRSEPCGMARCELLEAAAPMRKTKALNPAGWTAEQCRAPAPFF